MLEIEFDDKKLREELTKLQKSVQEYKGYLVGFFEGAKYDDGTPVAQVAASNEFGLNLTGEQPIPSRPFFRIANKKVHKRLTEMLAKMLDEAVGYILTKQDMNALGAVHKAAIQKEIKDLRTPPNSAETIARKHSSNPLIDSGFMRRSVTYKVLT
jgi:hypothetical protein